MVQEIASGQANDVWMLIPGFGLRRHDYTTDAWEGPATGPEGEILAFASDSNYMAVGFGVEQMSVTFRGKSENPSATNLVVITNLIMTPGQYRCLLTSTNRDMRVTNRSTQHLGQKPAIGIYDLREARWQAVFQVEKLPAPPTRLLLDGSNVWVAGEGYLAMIDVATRSVRRICYIRARSVDRIQIAGGFIWAQFDQHLYRAALNNLP